MRGQILHLPHKLLFLLKDIDFKLKRSGKQGKLWCLRYHSFLFSRTYQAFPGLSGVFRRKSGVLQRYEQYCIIKQWINSWFFNVFIDYRFFSRFLLYFPRFSHKNGKKIKNFPQIFRFPRFRDGPYKVKFLFVFKTATFGLTLLNLTYFIIQWIHYNFLINTLITLTYCSTLPCISFAWNYSNFRIFITEKCT